MAILCKCPNCGRKQAVKNKKCKCGRNLDRAKQSRQVRYYIDYRAEGKQKQKSLASLGLDPYSLKEAKDADAQLRLDKRQGKPIFGERLQFTFSQIAEWYLNLESVKQLYSYWLIETKIKIFNLEFGECYTDDLKPEDLRDFQIKRKNEGMKPATVDQELSKARAMVSRAVDNDLISADVLRVFDKVKRTLKKGEDVRDRILSPVEFEALMKHADQHV